MTANGTAERELLSIGRMAELNCISVKALHVYQDHGLVEPRYVDSHSGFRYYDIDQCSTIDAISQMKALGFSLCEIKEIIGQGDPALLMQRTQEQIAALDDQWYEIVLRRTALETLASSCSAALQERPYGHIITEDLPDRWALVFDVPAVHPTDRHNHEWEIAVRAVKRQLVDAGIPLSLLHNVSGTIACQDVLSGEMVTHQALIFLTDDLAHELNRTGKGNLVLIPGGSYLAMYHKRSLTEDGSSVEYDSIAQLAAYAKDHGLEIAGDYIGETLAATPLFAFNNRDAAFRMLLPVK